MKKIQEQLTDYRTLAPSELEGRLNDAKIKYQELASALAMGKVKTVATLKAAKKTVARLATIQREKAIISEVTNG
jgi:ribosomal protein L29